MSISVLLYVLAVVFFLIAAVDWPPLSGKAIAIGLLFFALAHVVSGVSLKAS